MKRELINAIQSSQIKTAGTLSLNVIKARGQVSESTVLELRGHLKQLNKIKKSEFMPVIVATRDQLRRTITLCKTKNTISYLMASRAYAKTVKAIDAYIAKVEGDYHSH